MGKVLKLVTQKSPFYRGTRLLRLGSGITNIPFPRLRLLRLLQPSPEVTAKYPVQSPSHRLAST